MQEQFTKVDYRILFNNKAPPLVGAKNCAITRIASFCRILDLSTPLEPQKSVLWHHKDQNDVRTSGTWFAHTRHTLKTKNFGFGEISLKNSFCSTCAYNVPDVRTYLDDITILKNNLKAFQRRVAS